MFSIKKSLWTLIIAFSLFMGCSSQHSSDDSDQAVALQPPLPSAPSAQPTAADPISGVRWCRMDDWETYQIVLRMIPVGDQMQMEFIRISSDAPTVRYPFPASTLWEPKKDENPLYGKFSILTVKDPAEILKLGGFEEQKRIAEQILPTNTQIAHPGSGAFSPEIGITVKSRDLESGNVTARNMYPCSSYSATFNEDAPARPYMEIVMKISQSMDSYTPDDRIGLASAMSFSEPVDEFKISSEALNHTQWCSWREVDTDRLILRTVSVGAGKFIENRHTENFQQFADEEGTMTFLQENATHSEEYQMAVVNGRMTGQKVTNKDAQNPAQELFTFIQDAAGTKAMVRLLPKEPENSRPSFDDIYFECGNPKPLQFSTGFASKLPLILDLQLKQFNPPPPPLPAPPPTPPREEEDGSHPS